MLLATRFHFANEGDLYVGKFVVAERGTEKNGRMDVQGSAKKAVLRFGEFCYCFCLALPAAFTQPGDHLLAEPCTSGYVPLRCEFDLRMLGPGLICLFAAKCRKMSCV